jgi:hypothetical protein
MRYCNGFFMRNGLLLREDLLIPFFGQVRASLMLFGRYVHPVMEIGLVPHGQPMPTGKEIGSKLVANSAYLADFSDLSDL